VTLNGISFLTLIDSVYAFCLSGIFLCLVTYSVGLYSPSDDVIELTQSNFNTRVMQSDQLWMVEFYAPW